MSIYNNYWTLVHVLGQHGNDGAVVKFHYEDGSVATVGKLVEWRFSPQVGSETDMIRVLVDYDMEQERANEG